MSFGKRIRELRKDKGWTQKHLSTLIGLSSDAVAKMERDERNPTHETLQKLSSKDVFDVSIDYLLCKIDIRTSPEEQSIIDDINHMENMDEAIENLVEKHGIIIDGKRYSKEQIKQYLKMIEMLKGLS